MKVNIIIAFIFCVSCQGQKQDSVKIKTASKEIKSFAASDNLVCNEEVCLQLRNHDAENHPNQCLVPEVV